MLGKRNVLRVKHIFRNKTALEKGLSASSNRASALQPKGGLKTNALGRVADRRPIIPDN